MKNTLLSLLLALACAGASAGVIHFDDVAADETTPLADGYAGFVWDNVGVIGAAAYPGSGFETGTVSPGNAAFNRYGATVTITKAGAGTFDFVGAWFTSAWFEQEIAFDGLRDGQLVYSTLESFVLDTSTPVWVQLGWAGIDTLVIYNSSGTAWAMDEFTVPEPGSLALVGAALAGMAATRRRRGRA